ncbi:hypothetical protein [Lentzea aerocolonigenes]|uniref:hypothetical protein n=1 Tax=Lentzea aerocolonigenes TaxID=68170 RepID=UPI00138E2F3C|nr:hypothetical protein [Lentzea aerocolonigenes]
MTAGSGVRGQQGHVVTADSGLREQPGREETADSGLREQPGREETADSRPGRLVTAGSGSMEGRGEW